MTNAPPPGTGDQWQAAPDPLSQSPIEAYKPPPDPASAPADTPAYLPQPESAYPPPPVSGYPPQPASGYPPQPVSGYPPQPTPGYSPQPTSGYPPQPVSGFPPQPTSGYPPQPVSGFPPQPTPGYPGYPGFPVEAYRPPDQAYPAPAYQPAYGDPYGYGAYPPHRPTDGLAVASMVISLVAVPAICLYGLVGMIGVVGAILGHVARRRISRSGAAGGGMALAGIIVGWLAAAIGVLAAVGLAVLIMNTDTSGS